MDVDDEYDYESLEEKLEHLSEYSNLTQLQLLIQEIEFMMDHGLQPDAPWFERRIDYVIAYSALNWRDLTEQTFDERLATWCRTILQSGQKLMDDWSVGPIFDISDYYTMLHAVEEARAHFFEHYAKDDTDVDLFQVIAGMERL